MDTIARKRKAIDSNEQVDQDPQTTSKRGRTEMADNESDNNSISQDPKQTTSPTTEDLTERVEQDMPVEVKKAKRTASKKAQISRPAIRRQPMRACRVKDEASKKDHTMVTASSSKAVATHSKKEKDPLIGHPKPALSMELWNLILVELVHFPPSQLIELALSSKAMFSMVMGLPVWQNIINTSSLKPVTPRSKNTPYLQVYANRSRICEQCYGYTAPRGPKAALPVLSVEEGRSIQMCLPCRKEYYHRHPEPIPSSADNDEQDVQNQVQRRRIITKGHAQDMFRLQPYEMDMIPHDAVRNPHYRHAAPMRLYDMEAVRFHARRVHGGDVGIEAAFVRSRMIMETRRRNVEIRRRREEELRRQRREALEARLESENLEQRTARYEILQYINHGRTYSLEETITELDALVDLIRTREQRRATLIQRLEDENVQVNTNREIFMRYVTHGMPDIDRVVDRYIRQYGAIVTPSQAPSH